MLDVEIRDKWFCDAPYQAYFVCMTPYIYIFQKKCILRNVDSIHYYGQLPFGMSLHLQFPFSLKKIVSLACICTSKLTTQSNQIVCHTCNGTIVYWYQELHLKIQAGTIYRFIMNALARIYSTIKRMSHNNNNNDDDENNKKKHFAPHIVKSIHFTSNE